MPNLANYALTAVTNSPGTGGLSLTVPSSVTLPAVPFKATVTAPGEASNQTNSEIINVTAASSAGGTTTLTIERAAEGPMGARNIQSGDQFYAWITVGVLNALGNVTNNATSITVVWKILTGTIKEGSKLITGLSSNSGIEVGMPINGGFIKGETTVAALVGTTEVEMSKTPENSVGTRTESLGFGGPSEAEWEVNTGEAPWPLTLVPTASGLRTKAWWQRPLAHWLHPMDVQGNLGIGPKWNNIDPNPNGGQGAEVNIAIGGVPNAFGEKGGAMENLTRSSNNIALGDYSLYKMTTPGQTGDGTESEGNNIAIGSGCQEWSNASNNTYVGVEAARNGFEGHENSGFGGSVLKFNTSSVGENTGIGYDAMRDNFLGSRNVAAGASAGFGMEGEQQIAIGYKAMYAPPTITLTGCEVQSTSYVATANTAEGSAVLNLTGAKAKGFVNGARVMFKRITTGVTSFDTTTKYWVVQEAENTLGLATEKGGTAITVAGHTLESASTEFTLLSKNIKVPSTTGLHVGMYLYAATGQFREARTYLRGELLWYVSAVGTGQVTVEKQLGLETGAGASVFPPGPGATPSPETVTLTFVPKYHETQNTAVGGEAMTEAASSANLNVAIGGQAGAKLAGNENVLLGPLAGYKAGSGNVMIGYASGENESGSNKLYIANSNTTTPLIFGEFAVSPNAVLRFNADKISLRRGVAPVAAPTRPTNLQQVIELLVKVGLSL